MKKVVLCQLFLAAILHAETAANVDIAARMISDLLPLKTALTWPDPLKDSVYAAAELQSLATASLRRVMKSFQNDLLALQFIHDRAVKKPDDAELTFRSFFNPDEAYKLTRVLAGKDLTPENLAPLVEGIIEMQNAAMECRDTSTPLQNSADFPRSAEKVWAALQAIGVSDPDLRIVTGAFFRSAKIAAAPPIRLTYK
jgi:hypothetical protein